jgi:uncharacterized membrane protein (UPF0127 family)
MPPAFTIRVNRDWVLADRAREAVGFWTRGWGWMLRRRPPDGTALFFDRCRALHTWGMRFALDVVFLDADRRVLAVRRNVRPWRMVHGPPGTRSSLELPSGSPASRLHLGNQLDFDSAG